jgi:hypothetical protein
MTSTRTRPDRTVLRAAQRLLDRYLALEQGTALPPPPQSSWNLLLRADRQRHAALRLGLSEAASQLADEYLVRLQQLAGRCRDLAEEARPRRPLLARPTLRFLYEELLALHQEFEEVQIDLQEQILTVRTEPIVLEDRHLGRFEIRLDYASLGDHSPYETVPLQPDPPVLNSDVSHPHVNGNRLCEGDAKAPLAAALAQGRLCDFFLLIDRVLKTYNPESAYVRLEEWEGVACGDCGATVPPDDVGECDGCQEQYCTDCVRGCEGCDRVLCSGCLSSCDRCGDSRCPRCLEECPDCARACCSGCLDEGRCLDCSQESRSQEPDHDPHDTSLSPSGSLPASPVAAAAPAAAP